jgi:hypothetical protein
MVKEYLHNNWQWFIVRQLISNVLNKEMTGKLYSYICKAATYDCRP